MINEAQANQSFKSPKAIISEADLNWEDQKRDFQMNLNFHSK